MGEVTMVYLGFAFAFGMRTNRHIGISSHKLLSWLPVKRIHPSLAVRTGEREMSTSTSIPRIFVEAV